MRSVSVRVLVVSVFLVGLLVFCSGHAQAQSAADSYKAKCAMCHGADGKGDVPMGKKFGLKDLASPDVQSKTDAQINEMITKGKDKMPAYAGKLTAEQITGLVGYIRGLAKK